MTVLFQTYRECARHIRNTYFSTIGSQDWDVVDSFGAIDEVLFKQMVLYRLDEAYSAHLETAVQENRFQIVPSSVRIPVMISRDKGGGGYWDHSITELEPASATIAFREYFDWDMFDQIDYRYFRGEIIASSRHPEIVGHLILVETIHGKVDYEYGESVNS